MVFCQKCGGKLNSASKFCPSCGVPSDGKNNNKSGGKKGEKQQQQKQEPEYEHVADVSPIVQGMKKLYKSKILPLEKAYRFDDFHSPCMTDTDFDANPMVMLVGQYSVGKTTFIQHLLERDFLGIRIGPEPTTDRFVAVMHGPERIIPGNALAVQADKPFSALQKFGMAFLNKFECSQCMAPILEKITFIDTPGVLSGEKQRIGRSYDFAEVVEWFAGRSDRILLLFDAHKLDISDEFKTAIEQLRGNDDKIRVVLNKADLPIQKLIRVYGALMWSLGKVFNTPEVLRVYIGSFWSGELKNPECKTLLDAEQRDLMSDLRSLPRNSSVRKVNELVKRARMAKVHAYIINHLRAQFGVFGKEKKQEQLLAGILDEFKKVQSKYNLPMGDFPHVGKFKETLSRFQIWKFPKLNEKVIVEMEGVLSNDLPRLMKMVPQLDRKTANHSDLPNNNNSSKTVDASGMLNPFSDENAAVGAVWVVSSAMQAEYQTKFLSLQQENGKVSGASARPVLMNSGLPVQQLRKLWDLSDIDGDGFLDANEFAVACYLIDRSKEGEELPSVLPSEVVPPNKRTYQ